MNHIAVQFLVIIGIILNFLPYNASLKHDKVPCTPVGCCKCVFPNGLGIDLTNLKGLNLSLLVEPDKKLLYFPFTNIPVNNISNTTLNECQSGVSLCLRCNVSNTIQLHNLGSFMEGSFVWERVTDDPLLVYIHNDKITRIQLNCDEEAKVPSLVHTSTSSAGSVYDLRLTTYMACESELETGQQHSLFSTFVMILLVLFLVYFIGGILVLKFIRGATGWEALPNGDFWRKVIDSIKQMFVYLANGCHQPEVYDTI